MGKKGKNSSKRKLDVIDPVKDSEQKHDHEELANTIKGLHWKLRNEYRASMILTGLIICYIPCP